MANLPHPAPNTTSRLIVSFWPETSNSELAGAPKQADTWNADRAGQIDLKANPEWGNVGDAIGKLRSRLPSLE
jgi:hypothetical protein